MKELVIKVEEFAQLTAYLKKAPYEFSQPLFAFFEEVATKRLQEAKEAEANTVGNAEVAEK